MDIASDKAKLYQCIETALSRAASLGATQAEVAASSDEGLIATARKGEAETVEFTKNHGFGVTLYRGKAKGSSATSELTPAAVETAVAAAWDIAQHTSEDPCAGLADAELMATEFPDLDLDHPWDIGPEEALEMALACEAEGISNPGITNSEGATVSTGRSVRVYGNSHGFRYGSLGTQHGISCALIAGEGERMQRDFWSTRHRVPSRLQAPGEVGAEAARRALARLDPRQIPTGTYPVLFAAPVAGGLIGHLLSAIAGGSLYRKSSFLLDKLNQPVAAPLLSVYEKPRLVRGIASAVCDGDGLPTYEKHFVKDGILCSYMLGTYSARRLGMQSTANVGGARNIRVDDTGQDFSGLVKSMDKGLIVTELMGQGINLVTGDYSRGASGFWVESGEIRHPVQEITVAGNLADMYRHIVAIGTDRDIRGNIQSGSIMIDAMTVAGRN
ncbi:MAG: metalloprotease PmbA [Ketobacteraceae bacterium]|nr:metalloprotease PmbA [Ketobacteraceae bacterium]